MSEACEVTQHAVDSFLARNPDQKIWLDKQIEAGEIVVKKSEQNQVSGGGNAGINSNEKQ